MSPIQTGDLPEFKNIERPFELKSLEGDGTFTGYGSVFGNVDAYKETVAPGAFAESLKAWAAAGRLPPILWQHQAGEPIGAYDEMREDARGLFVRGRLLVNDVQRAKEAHALLKAKAISGLSIGFVAKAETFDRTTGIRTLTRVDLYEVSLCTFPANPAATVSAVKSVDDINSLAEAERFLRDAGISKARAVALVSRIKALSSRSDSEEAKADRTRSLASRLAAMLKSPT